MKKLKWIIQDKNTIGVFIACTVLHVLIFTHFKEVFLSAAPIGWLIFFISLIDVGATICVVYLIKKWKGGKDG